MQKVLILQNKFIGDVLVASLLAENLKTVLPEAEVHFFCYAPALGVLKGNPNIDKILSFDDKELKKFPNLLVTAQLIRKEKYDIIFDSYAKLQSRIITFLSGARIKSSYDKPFFKHIYTHTYLKQPQPETQTQCTAVDDRMRLLNAIAPDYRELPIQKPTVYLSKKEIDKGRALLEEGGVAFERPLVIIGVLGSSSEKSWPLPFMAELISFVQTNFDVDILFNYMPHQQTVVDQLVAQLPSKERIYLDILGSSIREFASILHHAQALIANEGGAINLAKAMRKPTFSIFSPHKFRKDWGCFENESAHQSVHILDIDEKALFGRSVKNLIKNPQPLYRKLNPTYVLPKVMDFLIAQDIHTLTAAPPVVFPTTMETRRAVSVVLITKNEEENMKRFLSEFEFADEIIIVDSHSTDNTEAIAREHPKVRFMKRAFDNFSAQKNYALSKAKNDWVLFFDADESLTYELQMEIQKVLNSENPKDAYFIRRKFFWEDKPIKYSGWQNDKAVRLFRKSKNRYDENKLVHETVISSGSVGVLENKLNHYSFTCEESYREKLTSYSRLKARMLYKKGIKPSTFFMRYVKPAFRFVHHYLFLFGFLDGKAGLKMANMHAYSVAQRYWFLKEMYQKKAQD